MTARAEPGSGSGSKHLEWIAVLDGIEASLRDADALVAVGAAAVDPADDTPVSWPAWAEPTGIGPIPVELVPRARAVLEALGSVSDRLGEVRDAAAEELAEISEASRARGRRSTASTEAPAPRHFDQQA